MDEGLGSRAAALLVNQAWTAIDEGHYQKALAAAGRAIQAARRLDDLVLLVRALSAEAAALKGGGDSAAALARYTEVLGLANSPDNSRRLDDPSAASVVVTAHCGWVGCALYLPGIPVRDLFGMLDAADRWLAATGRRDWRASVLLERALVHRHLDEYDAAVTALEEALAVKLRHPGAPGPSLAGIRYQFGDALRDAARSDEAVPHYQAILDDPACSPWNRCAAHHGLARCALKTGDPAAARREAKLAVRLAEQLGDEALCVSLDVQAEACRAERDLDAAWQAATRRMEAAGRIGGHYRPYYAALTATDIALDRADHAAAQQILADLDEHARAMDSVTGSTTHTAEAAHRHERLDELIASHCHRSHRKGNRAGKL
jgi:tetratricopeptide (TPR) repeat protein